jgi:hypothetical protein
VFNQYCEDCCLVYSTTPYHNSIPCHSAIGGVKHAFHDVAIDYFYIWERSAYSSNQGRGIVSTIRPGQGGSHVEKKEILYIDLQDYVNNLRDVLDEIYSHLTKNAVTVEVVVHGTLRQHWMAKLTLGKGARKLQDSLSWMKLIGIKLSLIVCDNSTKKKSKIS